ncbi:hypothetical protein [Paramagnetospirillum marisnigri]|jgi:hypothetical protein|uniref:hypothetical protein n=1 Tax=Paramagnetospirillum marisnigri TaxID=1285242 RepID=UPI000AC4A9A3|nr:hypothetical protein [Paramagnetospirillum marisnigri]
MNPFADDTDALFAAARKAEVSDLLAAAREAAKARTAAALAAFDLDALTVMVAEARAAADNAVLTPRRRRRIAAVMAAAPSGPGLILPWPEWSSRRPPTGLLSAAGWDVEGRTVPKGMTPTAWAFKTHGYTPECWLPLFTLGQTFATFYRRRPPAYMSAHERVAWVAAESVRKAASRAERFAVKRANREALRGDSLLPFPPNLPDP